MVDVVQCARQWNEELAGAKSTGTRALKEKVEEYEDLVEAAIDARGDADASYRGEEK